MRIKFLIGSLALAAAPGLFAFADAPETAEATAEGEADPGYVVREEKVINFETGKTETETVIEFPELEILPDLARPISIIIPRTEPDFDKIPFTIYNNEPSYYLPEEYRLRYYRRVPVGDESDVKTGDMFRADESDNDREEAREGDDG
jgi:hypothetical protein